MEFTTLILLNLFFFFFLAHQPLVSSNPLFPTESLPTKSGYLPVNHTSGSAIFYTYYEAQNPNSPLSHTPLLIWLQGGPGCSSMIGNFFELGPWRVNFKKNSSEPIALEPNPGSWNRIFGLLFLDNPIGTGFSIAAKPEEIPRNQHSIAKHLFTAISGFVRSDPSFKSRPIYITGESYAGKYVPAIGYYILKKNTQLPESDRVNLAGVAIGNGLTDPSTQVGTHGLNAYYSGFVNEKQKSAMEKIQMEAIGLVKMGNWSEATNARSRVLGYLKKVTGLATLFDFSKKEPYKDYLVTELLNKKEAKKALGVNGSLVFERCSDLVKDALHEDVMKSVKYMVEFLVRKSKILLYQGHLDLRESVVSNEAWLKKIKWEEIEKFLAAHRKVWKVNDELAGYVQKWGSLSHCVVLGAGHLMPSDKPLNSQAMIEDWVLDKGVFGNAQDRGAGHLVPSDKPLSSQAMIEDWVLDKGVFGNAQEVSSQSNYLAPF